MTNPLKEKFDKLELRRLELQSRLSEFDIPFVKHEKGDMEYLSRELEKVKAEIQAEATKLLESGGFKSNGQKKGRRIPGL